VQKSISTTQIREAGEPAEASRPEANQNIFKKLKEHAITDVLLSIGVL
jgi:hypothetical protein